MITIKWLNDDGKELQDSYGEPIDAVTCMVVVENFENVQPLGWTWDHPHEYVEVMKIRDGRPFGKGTVMSMDSFFEGQRVQTHPATNSWMRGDRFGEVVQVGRTLVRVKMDRSGLTISFSPKDLVRPDGSEF